MYIFEFFFGSFFFMFTQLLFFRLEYNTIGDNFSCKYFQRITGRNFVFAGCKSSVLALQLSCRRRELHFAAELWDLLAIEFLLPLFMDPEQD